MDIFFLLQRSPHFRLWNTTSGNALPTNTTAALQHLDAHAVMHCCQHEIAVICNQIILEFQKPIAPKPLELESSTVNANCILPSIHLPTYLWLYSPLLDLGRFFSFLIR
jgi:hypothetical protein